jgi:uncharacterized protein YrzB (UPF0473 family)
VVRQPTPWDASPENEKLETEWGEKERIAVVIPKDGNEWEFKKVMETREVPLYDEEVVYFYGRIFP